MTQTIKLPNTLEHENMTATGPQGGVRTLFDSTEPGEPLFGWSSIWIKRKRNNGGSWLTRENGSYAAAPGRGANLI